MFKNYSNKAQVLPPLSDFHSKKRSSHLTHLIKKHWTIDQTPNRFIIKSIIGGNYFCLEFIVQSS